MTGEATFQISSSIGEFWVTRIVTIMAKLVTVLTAVFFLVPAVGSGQDLLRPIRLQSDRAELTALLAQYDDVALSTAYSEVLRNEGSTRADLVRERLRTGDFRAGDQIALFIEGGGALQWDTLTVEPGPLIDVPTLGPIFLQGVLRSELETHLNTEISRFIQLPRVQARALIRVAIMGVGQPGFYMMPAELPLSEAVMLAGGPASGVDPGQIQVERGQDVIWSVEELLTPVAAGRTLNDLGLQAGDRIMLREGSAPGTGLTPLVVSTLVGMLTSVLLAIVINNR